MSVFFLLLFSTEIKRQIWAGKRGAAATTMESTSAVGLRAEEYIGSIVKAVQSLSKANIGALIVLSNGNLPKEIIESGVSLGAKISNQLIEGIFIPKAPLHDGAMIIYGDKIQAAGCFLPLTQRDFPKEYGTRHRAAIGVTEAADVSAIVVSEETGIVSVVKRGEITRYVDSESLKSSCATTIGRNLTRRANVHEIEQIRQRGIHQEHRVKAHCACTEPRHGHHRQYHLRYEELFQSPAGPSAPKGISEVGGHRLRSIYLRQGVLGARRKGSGRRALCVSYDPPRSVFGRGRRSAH